MIGFDCVEKISKEENTANSTFLKKHPSFVAGFYAFCVIAASITFYFFILRVDVVSNVFSKFMNIMAPVIYGLSIAFLLNPIMQIIEKCYKNMLAKRQKELSIKNQGVLRGFSILISVTLAIMLFYVTFIFLFPEIVESLANIAKTLPEQIDALGKWMNNVVESNQFLAVNIDKIFSTATDYITSWVQTDLLNKIDVWLGYITNGLASVFGIVFNLVIGLACSIYMLYNKEKFLAQCKKTLYAFLNKEHASITINISKDSIDIFTHSIIGKIIDSIIIGFICFVGVKILKMPYPVLISVIIGITNIIPFFGPWLGAIPCGLLILLTDPIKALYFGIFILCLQQFDGNFLTPKIVGNYIGLPAFWVLVSCLIGGGFYGVMGLILGVPIFAILYQLFRNYVAHRLKSRNLPPETKEYDAPCEELTDKINSVEVPRENIMKQEELTDSKDLSE